MTSVVTAWMAQHGVIVTPETVWPVHLPTVPRKALYALFESLRLDRGAEIGVMTGRNSVAMLEANPWLHLTCVDPWAVYDGYVDHRQQARMDRFHAAAVEALAPYRHRVGVVRAYSCEAVRAVSLRSLDVVYVDSNHRFDDAIVDIVLWAQRVRPGGCVAVHDYFTWPDKPYMQVVDAVDAYLKAHQIREWFTVGGRTRDEGRHTVPPTAVWFVPESEPNLVARPAVPVLREPEMEMAG